MKYTLETLVKRLQAIRLNEEEQKRMRGVVVEYMAHNPITRLMTAQKTTTQSWFVVHRFVGIVALLLVVVLLGSGVASAAEGAVPGDVLYPVKVNITEPVRTVFAATPEAKAEWEVTRAERRLAEAETLAFAGKLTEDYRSHIEAQLDTHLEEARAHVVQQEEALADLEETVDAVLDVHEGILVSLRRGQKDEEALEQLLATVRSRGTDRRLARNTPTPARETLSTLDAAETMIARTVPPDEDGTSTEAFSATDEEAREEAESRTKLSDEEVFVLNMRLNVAQDRFGQTTEAVRKVLDNLPRDTQKSIKRLLEDAEEELEEAEEAYEEKDKEETQESVEDALRAIRRVEAALRATINVKRLDPELWPIDIAPPGDVLNHSISPLFPSVDGNTDEVVSHERSTTSDEVRGEYRQEVQEGETKIDIEVRNR